MGPLPVPPIEGGGGGGGSGHVSAGVFPTMSQLRARMHERGATKEFNQLLLNGNNVNVNNNHMQRGRELPFPARPILPTTFNDSTSTNHPNNANGNNGNGVVGPGVGLRRYRDLYAAPVGGWPEPQPQRPPPPHQRRSDEGWGEGGYHAEEEEEEDMKDVLDRFEDDDDSDTEFVNPSRLAQALESRRSFEAIKPRSGHESFAVEEYYGTRDTMYSFDDSAEAGEGGAEEDRNSRWSGSIYSRTSILDPDKSEEARERFLERVGAMLENDGDQGRGGRGRGQVVPPVPIIPERFAKNWPSGKF